MEVAFLILTYMTLYYILLDHEENMLNKPVAYTPDVEEYAAWLQEGIDKFKN